MYTPKKKLVFNMIQSGESDPSFSNILENDFGSGLMLIYNDPGSFYVAKEGAFAGMDVKKSISLVSLESPHIFSVEKDNDDRLLIKVLDEVNGNPVNGSFNSNSVSIEIECYPV